MKVQLLINEEQVKGILPISENIAGQYLGTAMFEAQEIALRSILGDCLLTTLKGHETARDWESFPEYAELRDKCQVFLDYRTVVELLPKVSYKIANMGAIRASDQNVQPMRKEDIDAMIEDYQGKADWFCYDLQRWLLANQASFPELDECACEQIRGNLTSMASCGVWLGGPYAG